MSKAIFLMSGEMAFCSGDKEKGTVVDKEKGA
jgi:hypothetical protein